MKSPGSRRQPGILVAEGDPEVRGTLVCALRFQNCAVWEAECDAQTVEVLRRHLNEIDLVLLDARLPSQGGQAVLGILEQLKPGLRCCLLGTEEGRDLPGPATRQVFRKPFSLAEMARCLRTVQECA
jgi:CheY-like chemotaxis protein